MKKPAITFCLTVTIFLVDVFVGRAPIYAQNQSARFAGVVIKLPTPQNLCLIGDSKPERFLLDYSKRGQKSFNNKLLGMWISCDTQRKLQSGVPSNTKEWVVVSGYMSGNPPMEKTLPGITKETFLKNVVKGFGSLDLEATQRRVNKKLGKINEDIFSNKDAILVGKPLNLGTLAITDSVHNGVIMTVNSQLFVGIFSSTILNSVIINFFYYAKYINKNSIKETLAKS